MPPFVLSSPLLSESWLTLWMHRLKEPNLMLPTIISGIQCYFDKALGSNLLYRFERLQYSEIRKRYWTGQDVVVGTEKEMSCIYGAEHLLRMLGRAPPFQMDRCAVSHFSFTSDATADDWADVFGPRVGWAY